jgi:transposase InsO family protein
MLTRAIVTLASQYGRYGYRRITALLSMAGWRVGRDRVQRIWRREGLKVPKKHKPRGRLWLNDGSCIRLRPERANHVWSCDFVEGRTHNGRSLRIMTLIDEHTRECLTLKVARRINSFGVIETLADAMLEKGVPEHVRCDNVLCGQAAAALWICFGTLEITSLIQEVLHAPTAQTLYAGISG